MVPLVACSLLLAADPPAEKPKAAADGEVVVFKFPADRPDDLSVALASHPDVQIAEAEVRLAQAKLAKARQAAALALTEARGKLDRAKAVLDKVTIDAARVQQLVRQNVTSKDEAARSEADLRVAKATVAAAEADLRAATGGGPAAAPGKPAERLRVWDSNGTSLDFDFLRTPFRVRDIADTPAPASPTADKLRELLGKSVKLNKVVDGPPQKVLDALRTAAGTDLQFRWAYTMTVQGRTDLPAVALPPGERTVAAWLDLLLDDFGQAFVGGGAWPVAYVREYGLAVLPAGSAPPGSVSVAEFARRAAAEPAKPDAAGKPPSPEVLAKVKELLGKRVKVDAGQATPQAMLDTLAKTAGTDLTIRAPSFADAPQQDVAGGERTVAAWLDLLRDQWAHGIQDPERFQFHVRQYGLILCYASELPPGAVPLSQVK